MKKKKSLVFSVLAVLVCCLAIEKIYSNEKEERYAPEWRGDLNIRIAKALSKNKVTGCACYSYKENLENDNQYKVRCGCSTDRYKYYLVWTGIDRIEGPYSSD